MWTKRLAALAAIALMIGLAPARSQTPDAAAPPATARYSFDRVGDRLLRLDLVSGQIAICGQSSAGWVCQAAPEDRAALEKEIARLQDEVAGLKREIASLREPPPPRPPAELSPPEDKKDEGAAGGSAFKMPTQDDIERARAVVEKAWRRLVDMIVGFKNDVMKKS